MIDADLILELLSGDGPMQACEIAAAFSVSTAEALRSMRPLRIDGVIQPPIDYGRRGRKFGGPVTYRLVRRRVVRRKRRTASAARRALSKTLDGRAALRALEARRLT